MDFKQNYFEIFQLDAAFEINLHQLSARYRELQLNVHPDRFARGTAQEKRLSVQWATQINRAYDTLTDPLRRAVYLLEIKDIDIRHNPVLDPSFLTEQIALREDLEDIEAMGSTALPMLETYRQKVRRVMTSMQDDFGRLYGADIGAAEQTVYKMQFVNKLLTTVDQLEEKLLDY